MYCLRCGTLHADTEQTCPRCGGALIPSTLPAAPPVLPPLGADPVVRMMLPVGRSGLAIAAGYLGLFALLPIFAPVALLVGILAVRDLRHHPEKHGLGRAIFGIVMGSLFSIVLVFILFAFAAMSKDLK